MNKDMDNIISKLNKPPIVGFIIITLFVLFVIFLMSGGGNKSSASSVVSPSTAPRTNPKIAAPETSTQANKIHPAIASMVQKTRASMDAAQRFDEENLHSEQFKELERRLKEVERVASTGDDPGAEKALRLVGDDVDMLSFRLEALPDAKKARDNAEVSRREALRRLKGEESEDWRKAEEPFAKARNAFLSGNYMEAREEFVRARQGYDRIVDQVISAADQELYNKANELAQSPDTADEAIRIANEILERDPKNRAVAAVIAKAEQIKASERARELNDRLEKASVLAQSYSSVEEAIRIAKELQAQDPKNQAIAAVIAKAEQTKATQKANEMNERLEQAAALAANTYKSREAIALCRELMRQYPEQRNRIEEIIRSARNKQRLIYHTVFELNLKTSVDLAPIEVQAKNSNFRVQRKADYLLISSAGLNGESIIIFSSGKFLVLSPARISDGFTILDEAQNTYNAIIDQVIEPVAPGLKKDFHSNCIVYHETNLVYQRIFLPDGVVGTFGVPNLNIHAARAVIYNRDDSSHTTKFIYDNQMVATAKKGVRANGDFIHLMKFGRQSIESSGMSLRYKRWLFLELLFEDGPGSFQVLDRANAPIGEFQNPSRNIYDLDYDFLYQ